MITKSGVFMPTAEENKKYFWESDIVFERLGLKSGTFVENGKAYDGWLGTRTNEYGEIEWEFTYYEHSDEPVNVLEPIVEVDTYQTINGNDYLIDAAQV